MEAYTTPLDDEDCPIDEYNVFREVLGGLQTSNPAWYQQLTGHLSENQGKALTEVITLANQRQAAKESKAIEQQGGQSENISRYKNIYHLFISGYQFSQANVPGAFNFGAPTAFGK